MINLRSEPSLASMVLTRDGVWKYSYILPQGQEFPGGCEASVVITDRSGAQLASFEGELSNTTASWLLAPSDHALIPAGSNFEVFLTLPDGVYKVRYGRVVRREVSYPLSPVTSTLFDAAIYEDTLNRSTVGPRWIPKVGQVGMHPKTAPAPVAYAMASRSADFFLPLTLYDQSAVLWYAPTRGDSVDVNVGLLPQGGGETVIVLSSNYDMTNYLGVSFKDDGFGTHTAKVCTGSAPLTKTNQGSAITLTIPDAGGNYTIKYNSSTKTVSLYVGTSLSPAMSWTDADNIVTHGEGHRYTGVVFNATFLATGPMLYYFKVMDEA